MITPLKQSSRAAAMGATFEAWMDENKIQHDLCNIHAFHSTGRGVRASQMIKEGETVLQVPDDVVLLAEENEVAEYTEALGFVRGECDVVYESVPLILTLMAEKLKGADSKWAGYIEFLPSSLPGVPFQWEESARKALQGTSTLHAETMQPYDHPPAAVWDIFTNVVEPWFEQVPCLQAPAGEDALWQLYCWATAIVAAYSFELGESRLQGLVPLWDALNHVTGQANVRLSHNPQQGSLLMVATRDVSAGEELINNYGPLSNGELLRRYGFVEPCRMSVEELERVAEQARPGEHMREATLAHVHWQPPNMHDAAVVPLQDIVRAAVSCGRFGQGGAALQERLDFMHEWEIIPDSQRYTVACDGELQASGAEALRVLSMSPSSFRAFQTSVNAWRPPLPNPCANLWPRDLSDGFQQQWCGLAVAAVSSRRSHLPQVSMVVDVLVGAVGAESVALTPLQAAATVVVGEWVALDSCLARLIGQVLDGATMRMLHLEASPEACPRQRGCAGATAVGAGDVEDAGAPWLLQLSKRFWNKNMSTMYAERQAMAAGGAMEEDARGH